MGMDTPPGTGTLCLPLAKFGCTIDVQVVYRGLIYYYTAVSQAMGRVPARMGLYSVIP